MPALLGKRDAAWSETQEETARQYWRDIVKELTVGIRLTPVYVWFTEGVDTADSLDCWVSLPLNPTYRYR